MKVNNRPSPCLSPSNAPRGGGAATGQNYVTPGKAASLSMADKEDIGWVEPILVESDAEKNREK
jgi:hypothetical protein